ncbi:MAG: hypothetical protein H0U82_07000 [Actinobacteria bacterium]|nr:hypothetical protein [Actinomycetota bacterium]
MISAKVNVVGNWGEDFAKRVNVRVKDELAEATEEGARVASAAASSRRRTGRMAEMEVLPVKGTPTGWTGGFKSRAWYAGFQSRGTSGGITPLGFLEKGRTEARKSLIARLNRLS